MDTYIVPMDGARERAGCSATDGARCSDAKGAKRSSTEEGLSDTLRWGGEISLLILSLKYTISVICVVIIFHI